MNKKQIRDNIRLKLRSLSMDERATRSVKVAGRLMRQLANVPKDAKIALFVSLDDEVDTTPVISMLRSADYAIVVPRVEGDIIRFYPYSPDRLKRSDDYGITEPDESYETEIIPDVVVVPGVAFDRKGRRLGRGKGFYDKYLNAHKDQIKKTIAIGYDFQLIDDIPTEDHDFIVDEVVTESETIDM